MLNNIKLFETCLKNKESYVDKYYVKNSKPTITNDTKKLNKLMKANTEILDNISAYKIATKSKNIKMQNTILQNILSLLKQIQVTSSTLSGIKP